MFDKSKAAQYFVVAWVKDWSLRTFLTAVSDGENIKWSDAHKHYPWLPHDEGPFIRDTTVKRWTAEAMKSINDRFWDAVDNSARLGLADRVAKWNSAGAKMKVNPVRSKTKREQINLMRINAADSMSKQQMRRGSGHDWTVCK
ncbi:MAG: hypothetical protein CL536_07935 [Alcaligenaceae bacterium]|nr:hypothetical protein [Alcaligenaceae bacterium]